MSLRLGFSVMLVFGGGAVGWMDIDREEVLLETRLEILGSEQTQKNKT